MTEVMVIQGRELGDKDIGLIRTLLAEHPDWTAKHSHPIHLADETGHKESGDKFWTWVFKAELYVLFKIDKSRGSKVLVDVLGEEFNGVLTCTLQGRSAFDFILKAVTAYFHDQPAPSLLYGFT